MPEIEINTEGIMIKCSPSETYLDLLSRISESDDNNQLTDNIVGKVSGISGTLNDTKTGTLNGTKTGTLSGTKTGTLNGTKTGTLNGTKTGTLNGTKTGTLNGTKTGTLNGTKTGTLNSFENLSDIEQMIIETLFKTPNATQNYLSLTLNTPLRTIKRGISSLKSKSRIERIGSKKSGYWIIK